MLFETIELVTPPGPNAVAAENRIAPFRQTVADSVVSITTKGMHDKNTNMGFAENIGIRSAQSRSV
jgi:hypothetical protein